MVRNSWWWIAVLALGCSSSAQTARSSSPDASVHLAAQPLSGPAFTTGESLSGARGDPVCGGTRD